MSKNISDKNSVNNSPAKNETIIDDIENIIKLFMDSTFRDEYFRIFFEKSPLVKTDVGRAAARYFFDKKGIGKRLYENLPLDTNPIGSAIYKGLSTYLSIYDFSKVVDEINAINSSDESDNDKIKDIFKLAITTFGEQILLKEVEYITDNIAVNGIETLGTEALAILSNPYVLTALAIGGFTYFWIKTYEKLAADPNFNMDVYCNMLRAIDMGNGYSIGDLSPLWESDKFDFLDNIFDKTTSATITGLNQYIEDKLNEHPFWELYLPMGNNSIDNSIKDIDINSSELYEKFINEHPIWELDLPIGKNPIDNSFKDNDFKNSELYKKFINEHPIGHLDLPLTPNVRTDKNINSRKVFGSEVLEQIRSAKKAGYAAKHYIITPKSLLNNTDVTQSLDIKIIMALLEKEMRNELHTSPEGVYK